MRVHAHDPRPDVWIGHVSLRAADVSAVADALVELGMRRMELHAGFEILELRGGTHLIVMAPDDDHPADDVADFDLMVDDIDDAHAQYVGAGLDCEPIERGNIHDRFHVTLRGGCRVLINSSHVIGLPV